MATAEGATGALAEDAAATARPVPSARGGGRGGRGAGSRGGGGGGSRSSNDNNQQRRPRRRPTHFVTVRLSQDPQLTAGIKAAHALLSDAGARDTLVDAESAHVTLAVLDLGGEGAAAVAAGDEDEAASAVARCAARLAEGLPGALRRAGWTDQEAGSLTLRLGGLGCFDRGRVMFLRVLGGGGGTGEGEGEEEEGAAAVAGQGGTGDDDGGPAAQEGYRRLAMLQAAVCELVREWDTEAEGMQEEAQQQQSPEEGERGEAAAATTAAGPPAQTAAAANNNNNRSKRRRRRPFNPHLTIAKNWFVPGGRGRRVPVVRLDRLLLLGSPAAAAAEASEAAAATAAAAEATAQALRDAMRGPFDVPIAEILLCRMTGRERAAFFPVEASVPLSAPSPLSPPPSFETPADVLSYCNGGQCPYFGGVGGRVATSAVALAGGTANFVHRVAVASSGGEAPSTPTTTVVLKQFPPYVRSNPSVTLGQGRYFAEKEALLLMQTLEEQEEQKEKETAAWRVRAPRVLHSDDARHALIVEDAGEGLVSLFDALKADDGNEGGSGAQHPDQLDGLADALAARLASLGRAPLTTAQRQVFRNPAARSAVRDFIFAGARRRAVALGVEAEMEPWLPPAAAGAEEEGRQGKQQAQGDDDDDDNDDDDDDDDDEEGEGHVLSMGDLWPNALMWRPHEDATKTAWLLDWELARRRHPLADAQQMAANLWLAERVVVRGRRLYDAAAVQRFRRRLLAACAREWPAQEEAADGAGARLFAAYVLLILADVKGVDCWGSGEEDGDEWRRAAAKEAAAAIASGEALAGG
jgi:hypothetical protein